MKQWILEKPGTLSWVEKESPLPGTGELLIRMVAATTCGTDLKAFLRGHPQIPMPGPFGHEWSGVVESAGESARFSIGDPVYGVHTAPCQRCEWCKKGQENLCESIMETKVMGAFATHLLIPKRIADLHVFPLPTHVPPEVGCLIEPLACVMEGIRQLNPRSEDQIAIIGPGAIGILFGLALKQRGHKSVTLFGRTPERLQIAEEAGMNALPADEMRQGFYDGVIECTGSQEVWESSIRYAKKGGTAMLFGGLPSGTYVSFDSSRLHYAQIKLISPFHFGTEAVKGAKDLIEQNPEHYKPLITDRVNLSELPLVLDKLAHRQGMKYALIP